MLKYMVRVFDSSKNQKLYFGNYAPRPYLIIKTNISLEFESVISIIKSSFNITTLRKDVLLNDYVIINKKINLPSFDFVFEFDYALITSKGLTPFTKLGVIM